MLKQLFKQANHKWLDTLYEIYPLFYGQYCPETPFAQEKYIHVTRGII